MTKLFFTSDWHIGHKKVIELDNRPFSSLDEMQDVLISNFNNIVKDNDITYFLGDIGLCSTAKIKSVIDQLNGTKILIRGNHDRNLIAMYQAGFNAVTEKAQISIGDEIITMSHCPLIGIKREDCVEGNWHGEAKLGRKYSFINMNQYHLHGHIHSSPKRKIDGKQMDVGVVAWNYKPVTWDDVQSWIAQQYV